MRVTIEFQVPGEPKGKGRPRAAKTKRGVRMYTPAATKTYEQAVQAAAVPAMAGRAPLTGPLELTLRVVMPVPASWSLKRKAAALAGLELPAKKPDLDNILKAICDGLNGVAWTDDALVVDATVRKRYGAEPGVCVRIERL